MGLIDKLLCGKDPDVVFSYKTIKVVRIVDRRLGIIHRSVQFGVLLYILIYVFLLNKGYAKKEQARGTITTTVNGTTYSDDNGTPRVWDSVDAIYPPTEAGALFITTKATRTKEQQVAYCPNYNNRCKRDRECEKQFPLSIGKCNGTEAACTEFQWCPQMNPNKPWTTISRLETVEKFEIHVKATISFPSLEPGHTFSTMDNSAPIRYPDKNANVFTVNDVLKLAGTTAKAVMEDGVILALRMDWDCNLDFKDCQPEVNVKRLDKNSQEKGFKFRRADYYRVVGKLVRDETEMTGIRIFLTSRGYGSKTSPIALVLQLSSGLALLSLAQITADILLQYILPERKHYRRYKIEETPDFSEIREKNREKARERKRDRYLKREGGMK